MLAGVAGVGGAADHGPNSVIVRRVRKRAPSLTREAIAQLDEIAWFAALNADVRSWVGLVVQTGIEGFIEWLASTDDPPQLPTAPFAAVPAAAAREVTLEQTVELIRVAVEVGATEVPKLAPEGAEDRIRASVERYGREIGFAAAMVYARVAEQRGAWDARLQADLVDALIAAPDDRIIGARASALGWPSTIEVRALAVSADRSPDTLIPELEQNAARSGRQALAVAHGSAVLAVVSTLPSDKPDRPDAFAKDLLPGADSAVVGPIASSLVVAGVSVHAALSGLAALPGRPGVKGPVAADDLLPERALAGDQQAREVLIETCYKRLAAVGGGLLETADAVIAAGGALETAARAIPVHVNTLRYRLGRIEEVTGYSLRDPHQRFALQTGIVLGRLAVPESKL